MSDILTAPDRGPPAFDWRKEAVRLQAEVDRLALCISEETERAKRAEHALACMRENMLEMQRDHREALVEAAADARQREREEGGYGCK